MTEKKTIVITNVDSLLGYSVAYRFLTKWNNQEKNTEFRLLCRDKKGLDSLEEQGGVIREIKDYGNRDDVLSALKSAYYVLYVPESSKRSSEEGKLLFECASELKVSYLAMFSYIGLHKNMSHRYEHLHSYFKLEQYLPRYFDKMNYCIFQSSLWHQMFYYFGPMIEDHRKIQLLLDEDTTWGTIDLLDLVDAVVNLSHPKGEDNKTQFKFTAQKHMITRDMTEAAARGLDLEEIEYEKVSREDLYNYLSRIHKDNRFRQRPHHDHSFTFPLSTYLHKDVIEAMLEYLEFVNETTYIHETNDLKEALEKEPMTIQEFFKNSKDQFRKLR